MNISGIYKIQSLIKPNRVYIGSAKNIDSRWGTHLRSLRKNKHHSKKLQRHFNKYGESDLQFSILLGCEKEDLIKTEQYFIDSYNPYFNICKIAGSNRGIKLSEETKAKLSKAHKGKKNPHIGYPLSAETRKKLSDAKKGRPAHNKGIPMKEESRIKLINSMTGKPHPHKTWFPSEETKKKMSIARINYYKQKKLEKELLTINQN